MSDERALGELPDADPQPIPNPDGTPSPFVRVAATSVTPTPEGFDLAAFIQGIRPTRRAVEVFPNAHLVGTLEQIATRIEAIPEGVNVDSLVDEFDATLAKARASVWFEVEKRSEEWVKQFRADTAKDLGFVAKPPGGGQTPQLRREDDQVITLYQLAAQIVTPAGVIPSMLMAMRERNEGELAKLIVCMTLANNELAETADVFTRDFSSRRSTNNTTPGS